MAFQVNRRGILGDIQFEIARYEALLADLRNIATGRLPTEADLQTAPVLDRWMMDTALVPSFAGAVHGHPLRQGLVTRTTDIRVFAEELGRAQTLSKFYRLGQPAGTGMHREDVGHFIASIRHPCGVHEHHLCRWYLSVRNVRPDFELRPSDERQEHVAEREVSF